MGGWDTHPLREYNRFNFRDNIAGAPPIERFLGVSINLIPYEIAWVFLFESFAGALGGGFACNILTTPWVMERDISTAGTVFDWNAERMKLTDSVQGSAFQSYDNPFKSRCFAVSGETDPYIDVNGSADGDGDMDIISTAIAFPDGMIDDFKFHYYDLI